MGCQVVFWQIKNNVLSPVSDPVPVLEYALQIQKKAHRVSDLEIENKQLRDTLDEYNHEFAEVKNQGIHISKKKMICDLFLLLFFSLQNMWNKILFFLYMNI